jgi:hypothetical protein
MLQLGTNIYLFGGRYVEKITQTGGDPISFSISTIKDLGAGKACTDAAIFLGLVVLGMGDTEKIWTMDTSETFVQATDATFIQKLARVGRALYRSDAPDTHKVSYALTAPLTLASWTPANPNEFEVADSSGNITGLHELGGVLAVGKEDGFYLPNELGEFKNQIPHLEGQTSTANGKKSFNAHGWKWVLTRQGLIKVRSGSALQAGPDAAGPFDYDYKYGDGVVIDDDIFLLVEDTVPFVTDDRQNARIIKMSLDREGYGDREYRVHDFIDLGKVSTVNSADGYWIFRHMVTNNNVLFWADNASSTGQVSFSVLGGHNETRAIDNSLYIFGSALTHETGLVSPTDDLSVENTLVGCSVLLNLPLFHQEIKLFVKKDGETGGYVEMTDSMETSPNRAVIGQTKGYESKIRFAPRAFRGNTFEFKVTGAQTEHQGPTGRAEIREIWAYGYSHPRVADVLTISINADESRVAGIRGKAKKREHILNYWRKLIEDGESLIVQLPGYEPTNKTRFIPYTLNDHQFAEFVANTSTDYSSSVITIKLVRVDFGGEYAEEARGF